MGSEEGGKDGRGLTDASASSIRISGEAESSGVTRCGDEVPKTSWVSGINIISRARVSNVALFVSVD